MTFVAGSAGGDTTHLHFLDLSLSAERGLTR